MSTFAQTTDNDLTLEKGALVLITGVAECAAVELRNRFLFAKGEWFLDTRVGVPYFAHVFKKNPNLGLIRRLFEDIILNTPGVAEIREFELDWDTAKRVLSFSFEAVADDGKTITGGSGQPFIVKEP